MKTVFVNPERCIGCKQCQIACAVEHSENKDIYSAVFEPVTPRPRILVAPGLYFNTSFPNKCRHCDPAPCLHVCPTGAISRDEEHNIVCVDGRKCITCAMCAMVCPFDVLTFYPLPSINPQKPVALKCDQCSDRQQQGKVPVCVEACKVNALEFGDLNELIKKSRTHLAREVSVAVGEIKPPTTKVPAHVESWRQWGEAVDRMNSERAEGGSDDNEN
ncbi:MAG: 4Fe-4S dicluster domain-containing protein [bacterium]